MSTNTKNTALVVVLAVVAVAALWGPATLFNDQAPDNIKAVFDAHFAVIALAWGLIHTRLPWLKNLPNALAPIFSAVAYILTRLGAQAIAPDAHAGVLDEAAKWGGLLWTVARGGATSAVTSVLYDKLLKFMLDKVVPVQKPAGA